MKKTTLILSVALFASALIADGHGKKDHECEGGKEAKTERVHAHQKGHECYKSIAFQAEALKNQKKYSEAIEILEKARANDQYTNHSEEIYTALFSLYNDNEQFEKNIGLWNEGHKKGMVFNIDPTEEKYKPYHTLEGFIEIADKDKELSHAVAKEGKESSELRGHQHKKRDHEKEEVKKDHKEKR